MSVYPSEVQTPSVYLRPSSKENTATLATFADLEAESCFVSASLKSVAVGCRESQKRCQESNSLTLRLALLLGVGHQLVVRADVQDVHQHLGH